MLQLIEKEEFGQVRMKVIKDNPWADSIKANEEYEG